MKFSSFVTERELSHLQPIELLLVGDLSNVVPRMEAHLSKFPRDAFIASQCIHFLFFNGGAGKKTRIIKLIESLLPEYGRDPRFMGRYAFHLTEVDRLVEARRFAEDSLQLDPKNTFALHAMVHIFNAESKYEKLIEFIDSYNAGNPPLSFLSSHMHWHKIMALLHLGKAAEADSIFRTQLRLSNLTVLDLGDAASVIWKRFLEGHLLEAELESSISIFVANFSDAKTPFALVNVALLLGVQKNTQAIDKIVKRLKQSRASDC